MNQYKLILDDICKPLKPLNAPQMTAVVGGLMRGTIEQKLCGTALSRLDAYLNLMLQMENEQTQRLTAFLSTINSEQESKE